jgi:nitrogen regulatory protein PII 2
MSDMKEIIAIIRTDAVESTKKALESVGVKGITFAEVIGRGRQRGTIQIQDREASVRRRAGGYILKQRGVITDEEYPQYTSPVEKEFDLGFLPKKMLIMVTENDDVPSIVQALIRANQTGKHGDGRIFVCPLEDSIRVRTGEHGAQALS